jgi:hypothetical protein
MMQQTGYENMSDDELARLLAGQFQPTDAQTGQPLPEAQAQAYQQLNAAGGLDPRQPPGSARFPKAQGSPQDVPGAGEFYVTPQGLVQQQPQNDVDNVMDAITGGVRAFARGVPALGAFADEANAATAATVAPFMEPMLRNAPGMVQQLAGYDPNMEIGDAGDWQARYDAAKSLQTLTDQQYDQENPVLSPSLQVGGAIGGTIAGLRVLSPLSTAAVGADAGLLMRSGAAAVEGAGLGAIHGYGSGQGSWTDPSRLKGAGGGAVLGGLAGGTFPVAAHAAGQGWRATGGRVIDAIRGERAVQGGASAEAERIARALRGDAPAAERATMEGQMATAMQPELRARASEVDDAYVRIAKALERGKTTPGEAIARVEALGPHGVLADVSPAAQDLMRAAINRPGKGSTIAEANLSPRQRGVFNKDTGEYDVRPSSLRITDEAAEGLGVGGRGYNETADALLATRKATAGPAYAKAYQAPPADLGEFRDFAGSPLFKKAYERARSISEKEFVTLPDGTEVIQPLPQRLTSNATLDWRTLDLMKQGLDDLIKEGKVQGIGVNEQGAIKGYLQRFVAKLDGLNPDYKVARETFAGPTAMRDALEEGRALLREDAYTIGKRLGEMTPSEQEMVRLGALQELQTKLGNANVTFDAANQAGLLKPNQLARFKELFPTREAFSKFITTLENEKAMFSTNQAAFGNSTTAKQILNVMEPSDPQLEGAGLALTGVAQGGNPLALIQAIRRMGMESPMSEPVAETIASVLTNPDKARLAEVLRNMEAAGVRGAAQDVIRRMQGTGAAQAASGMANQPRN